MIQKNVLKTTKNIVLIFGSNNYCFALDKMKVSPPVEIGLP